MKRAKLRMHPPLACLNASTRRAERALTKSLAIVSASDQRIARKRPRYTLAELIAQSPRGLYVDREWEQMVPVGRELL
jgi:hypothetical protein